MHLFKEYDYDFIFHITSLHCLGTASPSNSTLTTATSTNGIELRLEHNFDWLVGKIFASSIVQYRCDIQNEQFVLTLS